MCVTNGPVGIPAMKVNIATFVVSLLYFITFVKVSRAIHSCPFRTSYDGFSAISVVPSTNIHMQLLSSFLSNPCEAFLYRPDGIQQHAKNVVVISTNSLSKWDRAFSDSYTVITHDLASALKSAPIQRRTYVDRALRFGTILKRPTADGQPINKSGQAHFSSRHTVENEFYQSYFTLEILQEKWTNLSKQFPDQVELKVIGRSHQNRPIHALFVGRTDPKSPRRILINSLLHAREWVTPPAVTYAAERLAVETANAKQPFASLLNNVQVIFVPVANPDGYEFTATNDRLWRKNRRPGQPCAGVDLNRNWDMDFGGPHTTSVSKCSEIYTGPFAFSEPETQSLRNLVLETPGIAVHVDVHSFSQLVLGPWSHSYETPPNLSIVEAVGNGIAEDLSNRHGHVYRLSLNSKVPLLYLASGVMSDWMFSKGILSFGFELRPSEDDVNTFLLPEDEILPTCEEVFACFPRLLNYARNSTESRPTLSPTPSQSASPAAKTDSVGPQGKNSTTTIVGISVAAGFVLIALFVVAVALVRSRRVKPDSEV